MSDLDACLKTLSVRHRAALHWFFDRAGTHQAWPVPLKTSEGETLLAAKAKGIYKPEWSQYALSVRQNLNSPYADRDPVSRPDGSWLYSYFQENPEPSSRDDEYTNRALMACIADSVPVAVMRQIHGKPRSLYHILGLALVTGWEDGYFFFEGFSKQGTAVGAGPFSEMDFLRGQAERSLLATRAFDPTSIIDARERIATQIVRRQGQPAFRRALLSAYEGRCAVTGCDAEETLEAAHIVPYRGAETDRVDNGLLLRADIHTLFDLGLIAIATADYTILTAQKLIATAYADLQGRHLTLPRMLHQHPSTAALQSHRAWCRL